jgi:hypothetical protein
MSTRKLLLLTAVFLGLLAFVILYERHQPTSEERAKAARRLLDFQAEDVTAVRIERPDLPTVELKRNGGRWVLAGELPGRADGFTADGIVSDLGRLELVGDVQTAFDPKEYGLDRPKATVTLTFKEGPKRTVSFGKGIPGTDGTAAAEGGRLGAVRGAPLAALLKPVSEFRSKRLFDTAVGDVTKVTILKGPNRVVLAREDAAGKPSASWRIESPVSDLASESFVERLLSDLSATQISEFPVLSPTDLSRVGLAPPAVQVTLQKGAEVVAKLSFGAAKADVPGKVYAKDGDLAVVVDDRAQEDLGKEFLAMRESRLLPVDAFRVRKVEFEAGELRAGAEKVDGEWRSGGRVIPPSPVESLVGRVSRAESRGFVSRKDYAARGILSGQKGAKPLARIEISEEKAPAPAVVQLWTAAPLEGSPVLAAEVTGRADALLVEAALLDDLRRDAEKLRDAGKEGARTPAPALPAPATTAPVPTAPATVKPAPPAPRKK